MSDLSHTLSISSPAIPLFLGQPALQTVRLEGTDNIGSLFSYELTLKTPDSLNLQASSAGPHRRRHPRIDALMAAKVRSSSERTSLVAM